MKPGIYLNKFINRNFNSYFRYLSGPVDKRTVLIEAGQGKNINGNMFALLRELEENPHWKDYSPVFVVTESSRPEAEKRFCDYGFSRVVTVTRDSSEYKRYLATAGYLMTDNSFPAYFSKREEQICLNTWHGTPLKHLGRSTIRSSASIGNVQKNFFMSDYALFPNDFTRQVFFEDYMIEPFFSGRSVMLDYPRNEVLRDQELSARMKRILGVEGRQVIAYMPTWRGSGRTAEAESQLEVIARYLTEIDRVLEDDQVMMVNMHFLVRDDIDYSSFAHIIPFAGGYETYEILSASDMLVTDYSSVFFDYASTGRKIILFTYDMEDYMKERGFYMDIADLPFRRVTDVQELKEAIDDPVYESYEEFRNEYCSHIKDNVSFRLLKLVLEDDSTDLDMIGPCGDCADNVIYSPGSIKDRDVQKKVLDSIGSMRECGGRPVLVFQDRITDQTADLLEQIPEDIVYVRLMSVRRFSIAEELILRISRKTGLFSERADAIYREEAGRLMYKWKYKAVINTDRRDSRLSRVLGQTVR